MPVAFVQEFAIENRSTTNYDAVKESLGDEPIEGLILHTAGFDDDNNVFRIFDVWESRAQAERFLERVMSIVGSDLPRDVSPPTRQGFYELHDMAKP
jgi:hypothetical protein